MAMKYLLNSTAYAALSDEVKKEYIAGDKDGEFILDVQGYPAAEDVGPIKRALEAEKAKVKTLGADKAALQAKLDEAPDVEALKATHTAEVGKYKAFTEKTLLDATADSLAGQISNAPKLLSPVIKTRLTVDMTGELPVVKILGQDGKPSADLTVEKLGQELVANADYKAIIKASNARGSGAPLAPIKPGGGGTPIGETQDKAPDLSALPGKDLAARITERKAAAQANQGA